jgi:hypothetical protein
VDPAVGLQFDLAEQGVQVRAVDVQQVAVVGQGVVDVGLGEADAPQGRGVLGVVDVGRRRDAVGIGSPDASGIGHGAEHQQDRAQAHRHEDIAVRGRTHGPGDQGRAQGDGAAGRVQAAQQAHGDDRAGHGGGRRQGRMRMEGQGAGHPGQGRDHVAADDGAGLGQRTGRHREGQHRRGADRRDQQRQRRRLAAGDQVGQQAGGGNADQGPQARAQDVLGTDRLAAAQGLDEGVSHDLGVRVRPGRGPGGRAPRSGRAPGISAPSR